MAASESDLGVGPNAGRPTWGQVADDMTSRVRELSRSRPFLAFVIVTALVVGVYYFIMAAPIYVSHTSFSIRGREQPTALMAAGGLLGALGQPTNTGMETAEIEEYVASPELLARLDAKFHLREMYSQPRLDPFWHMRRDASADSFLRFYQRMVHVRVDHDTNIVSLDVHAFDGPTAQKMANEILVVTADYLNALSGTVREDTLRASRQELDKAEQSVRDSRLAMTRYRTSTGLLDPTATAMSVNSGLLQMRQEILDAQAERAGLATFSTPKSPQIQQLDAKIAALQGQIGQLQGQLTSGSQSASLARRLYEFEGLQVANEYAEKQLVAAMAAYDSARAVADQRDRFLVRIVNPNLPDRPSLPHRMKAFLETLMVAIAAYGIIALAIAAIRDHQGI